MRNINIRKYYAIYHYFNSLLNEKKQLYRLRSINICEIQEQVAIEFGFTSIYHVQRAIKFISENRNSPHVQKQRLLFHEERKNYYELYGSDEDIKNLEIIEQSIKNKKHTKTAFIFYFIYRRYCEMLEEGKCKSDVYFELSEEFYYTNPNSIRNIIRQVKNILCKETIIK